MSPRREMTPQEQIEAARAAGWPISADVAAETIRRAAPASATAPDLLPPEVLAVITPSTLDSDIAAFNARSDASAKAAGRAPAGTRKQLEDAMQMRVIRWADANAADYPGIEWLFHVPNGGKRGRGVGGQMKALGARAGVIDLHWLLPRGIYPGAAWELKVTGGKLQKLQRDYIHWLSANGYYVSVIYDHSETVIDEIKRYYQLERGQKM